MIYQQRITREYKISVEFIDNVSKWSTKSPYGKARIQYLAEYGKKNCSDEFSMSVLTPLSLSSIPSYTYPCRPFKRRLAPCIQILPIDNKYYSSLMNKKYAVPESECMG